MGRAQRSTAVAVGSAVAAPTEVATRLLRALLVAAVQTVRGLDAIELCAVNASATRVGWVARGAEAASVRKESGIGTLTIVARVFARARLTKAHVAASDQRLVAVRAAVRGLAFNVCAACRSKRALGATDVGVAVASARGALRVACARHAIRERNLAAHAGSADASAKGLAAAGLTRSGFIEAAACREGSACLAELTGGAAALRCANRAGANALTRSAASEDRSRR